MGKTARDIKFMRMALSLALKGEGFTSPNPYVGAILVKGNRVVGKGYHKRAGSPHAEIVALNSSGVKAKGSTLYVNLEPCIHYGRTPPCVPEIVKAGIKRVVIGMIDPNPLVSGKGIEKLKSEGIDTQVGILEGDAKRVNEIYIKYITKEEPFVVLKWAMSLDGKIATCTGDSRWISHESSREVVYRMRGKFDAILIGIETLIKDDPILTTHQKGRKEPKRVIIDSMGRIPLSCKLLKEVEEPVRGGKIILATTHHIKKEKIEELKNRRVEIIFTEEKNRQVNLKDLMKELGRRQITSLMVEGGGEVTASFLKDRLADRVLLFTSPIIIGGRDAKTPVEGEGVKKVAEAISIHRLSYRRVGEDIMIEGYIKY